MAALAREQKGYGAGVYTISVMYPRGERKGNPRLFGDSLCGNSQLLFQVILICGSNGQSGFRIPFKIFLGGSSQIGQKTVFSHLIYAFFAEVNQALGFFSAKKNKLAWMGAQAPGLFAGAFVFLQGNVEIGASKAKRTDCGPPRIGFIPDPGARLGIEIKGAVDEIHLRVGFIYLDSRWKHLMTQGHNGLD